MGGKETITVRCAETGVWKAQLVNGQTAGPSAAAMLVVGIIAKIEGSDVPEEVRQEVRHVATLADRNPAWAADRLRRIASPYLSTLPYRKASHDLYRCVPVQTVHRHMTDAAWQAISPLAYRRRAEAAADPAAFVRSTIPPRKVIFPSLNSWLIDASSVRTMNASELHDRLELGADRQPPFVLFHLTVQLMAANGVEIREPTVLDAAAGGQFRWSPAGLSIGAEYVDRDVPIEAVEEVLWKP